jgi:DNA-binding CsgD family transcriptional regulator
MQSNHLFNETVSSLYETVLDEAHWDSAIRNVAALFEAPKAATFRYDFTSQVVSDFRAFGLSPDVERIYSAYYHQLDPGRSVAMCAPVGEWNADETMLDLEAPAHQEYVQDFALRSGIGRIAGCKMFGDTNSCVYLSLARHPGASRFGEAARQQYLMLRPHFIRVAAMRSRITALAAVSELTRACLDRLQCGIVVVDSGCRVHLINAHGLCLVNEPANPGISNQRLVCSGASLNEQLCHLVKSACNEPPAGGALRVPNAGGIGSLLLSIVPIPRGHDLAAMSPAPLALVVMSDPAAPVRSLGLYKSVFSLTSAELQLLEALARGTSVVEWAMHRHASIATVRTQLRSLFEKTGVDTQARLVALAKSFPPVA